MVKQKTPKTTKTKTTKRAAKAPAAAVPAKVVAKKVTDAKIVAKKVDTPKASSSFAKLRMWNIRIAVVLVLEAAAIVLFGKSVSAPIVTQYLATDPLATAVEGHAVVATATRNLFDMPVAWLVVAFLLLLAAVHVAVATVYRKRYEAAVERGVSEARWMGLGAAGAVALLTISLLGGVQQLSSLLMIAALMIVGCLALLVSEVLALQSPKRLIAHLVCGLGLACVVLPLVVLLLGLGGALLFDGQTPGYLYGVYASAAVFVAAAAVATHLRLRRKGKWSNTYFTEQVFMALGFVAVSALAWQVFAGVLAS